MVFEERNTQILKSFGARVRELRLRMSLSQEDLADRAGLDRTYVGGVERGERNLSLINIFKLAHALETSVPDLTRGLQ
ncbi:helix-turn-helix transcriptional regulator [Rhizobium sp. WYCCWR 11290]|uniref:Helix-turn-helix transcriptional regulator n=1 Tax=Rhizobium changzhiense TaxID=2692317 RepID=A0A7Z0ZV02_9HYPH|nr:helix-turn-helix transcriptional regulator [Rhizobium changzhiense]NZD64916.1 helix-turn-helix transcriptional regulator [Rhizobium changzhiense]